MIDVFGKTIQGKRTKQEDSIYYQVKNNVGMAVVCDGMGGLEEGDWASYIAVRLMKKHFNRSSNLDDIPTFFHNEIHHLDNVICKLEDDNNKLLIAGTTYTSTIIRENKLYWASVGDSKVYVYSQGKLRCLTRTHNYKLQLDQELNKGMITQAVYNEELKKANCLISYLGVGNMEYYDISSEPIELTKGDVVLICSDGVFSTMSDLELINVINSKVYAKDIVNSVISQIEEKNKKGQDNASLVVLKYIGN
ncbi:MAG: serine/threonine-protein phosphatase [Lachnospiraceae bacterium]|nr:serine/threonine-protein phosphatase [Lachnospiraceae bacterium]